MRKETQKASNLPKTSNSISLTPSIETLQKIVKKPNFEDLSREEATDLWVFRYYIKNQGVFLPKFLKSVDWSREPDAQEAMALLDVWDEMKYHDAIFLLSRDFCANNEYSQIQEQDGSKNLLAANTQIIPKKYVRRIREHAINILRKLDTKEISKIHQPFLPLVFILL